eukprot:8400541-Prorocentrum_lima.AAC.1
MVELMKSDSPARFPNGTETDLLLCHASGAKILLSAEKPSNPMHVGAMTPHIGVHYLMYRQRSCT